MMMPQGRIAQKRSRPTLRSRFKSGQIDIDSTWPERNSFAAGRLWRLGAIAAALKPAGFVASDRAVDTVQLHT
jgi:hypothetical protein